MNTCDSVIQCPGWIFCARSRIYASTSATLRMSEPAARTGHIEAAGAWTRKPIRPGNTVLLWRSIRLRARGGQLQTSSLVPTDTIRPSRTAMASTVRNRGSTVTIVPL